MSKISQLKKAHQAQAITQDTHTLQDFLSTNKAKSGKKKDIATMDVVGLEAKYIPQFDANSPMAKPDAQGNGYRTRFILSDGSTIGTFSGGAFRFFQFFADLMGQDISNQSFSKIEVQGNILVDVSKVDLDGSKSTYNFEIVEEGSNLEGFQDGMIGIQELLPANQNQIEAPEGVDTETGEIEED